MPEATYEILALLMRYVFAVLPTTEQDTASAWPNNHTTGLGNLCPTLSWGSISGQHTVFISWPAITNDHRLGGLTQQEQLWNQLWRPEV